ncbi:MAG: ATP-grasp domain-containing protein [Planctomycetota bacterium]|jgi:glutathione synthase/RimK-type ligase-like ATP-grasp enzyme
MRIALATCEHLPDWEVDDRPFHDALARRGVDARLAAWSDASVDWSAFDACLVRTTWDYQERRDEYLAWAERVAATTPLFNPLAVIRWNTHKWYLRDLETAGVPVIPTAWLPAGTTVDLAATLAERGWERGFLKPAVGATARETLPFDADDAGLARARAHLDRLLPREDLLLQPFLPRVGVEGELSAVFIDGRLSHAVRKVPAAGDYRVQDDWGATDEPATLDPAATQLVHDIIATVGGGLLYARVDLLRDDAGDLRLSELELVEPSLFFRHGPGAADRLADALCRRVG